MWAQLQIGACTSKPLLLVGKDWAQIIKAFYENYSEYFNQEDRNLIHFSPDIKNAVQLRKPLLFTP